MLDHLGDEEYRCTLCGEELEGWETRDHDCPEEEYRLEEDQ